jgi:hypothetical protein
VVDVDRQIILAQSVRQAPWNDCATLPVLLQQAHQHTPVGCVLKVVWVRGKCNRGE